MKMPSDRALVRKFKGGDPEALLAIYQRYRDYLLSVAMAMVCDMGRAEDAVHDVFVSLARKRQELPAGPGRNSGDFHEFHHDGRTCYWRYDSFPFSDAAKKEIDAVFKDIREHNARNLIIDLRFNGGGNSMAGEYILDYLTSKPSPTSPSPTANSHPLLLPKTRRSPSFST